MAAIQIDHNQFQQMMQSEHLVLVDYWAPWCSYCRRIGPAYDRIAEAFDDQLIVAKVNIDDAPQLAQAEQIEVIPTLVLYRNGQALDSIVAPESQAAIQQFIQQTLAQ